MNRLLHKRIHLYSKFIDLYGLRKEFEEFRSEGLKNCHLEKDMNC